MPSSPPLSCLCLPSALACWSKRTMVWQIDCRCSVAVFFHNSGVARTIFVKKPPQDPSRTGSKSCARPLFGAQNPGYLCAIPDKNVNIVKKKGAKKPEKKRAHNTHVQFAFNI